MNAKRTINARDIVMDVRSRKTDAQLMEKYHLSAHALQKVMKKLVEARLLTQAELDWRPMPYDDTVVLDLNSVV